MPFIKAFRQDTHPMAMISTLMAAMSSFYPEANPAFVGTNIYNTREERNLHIFRILGVGPAVAAAAYRHLHGLELIAPDCTKGWVEVFLDMCDLKGIKHVDSLR